MHIFDPTAPMAPTTMHVRTVADLPASVRFVTTPTSTLTIGAAPWRHARRLAQMPVFSGPCIYVLAGDEIRIGKSTGLAARLRDHRRTMPMPRIDQTFVVASPGFGADAITALEAILTQAARKAGVMPVVGALLKPPSLDSIRDHDVMHWLRELPFLLLASGCTLFDPDFAPQIDRAMESDAPRDEYRVPIGSGAVREGWRRDFPADLLDHPATRHFVLERGALQARASVNGQWTVLRAGSLLTASPETSEQVCIARKRKRLRELGLLDPAGVFGRLNRDIAVPSLTNGGRLASGTNIPASAWRAL
ncbi:hypothetical protein [Bosea rubneri]|uniref:GIY-YIG nuclease family protein n=1 Tax=Bosea rubneri TaxID=3075434 RepID=A0ABU3S8I7_9HYPH|nr:hypothetical protein [Bosea sp. ZW T0_25]MDU0341103.1 hypothetical protein [Bosea sp. ZW T0_25]